MGKHKFSVTLGRKIWMALTGAFLIVFLVIHLLGNLQLLVGEQAFNDYAALLAGNPLIKIVAPVLYISILVHAIFAAVLTSQNKKARPVGYKVENASANSAWSSRNMGALGTVLLVFIVVHMQQFWYKFKIAPALFGAVKPDSLYDLVYAAFKSPVYVAIYVVSMLAMGYHLNHGFQSAFQTLGINHKKYTPAIKKAGTVYSIVVSLGFALLPIIVYFFM
ncbi:MAG: succinate dehydrogenase cytochrome b subunit [Cytophagales bacterium]|nr:succinate dehydrogenase cytochrome b subunit [Cytophagales bacterium]